MPYNPNDPNFQTKQSRVASFKDFTDNIGKEKDELKKMNRSFHKPGELNQTPGGRSHKYNKVTHKIDDLSKAEVVDDIEAIEEKYKIVESKSWLPPKLERDLEGLLSKDDDIGKLARIIDHLRDDIGSKKDGWYGDSH